jgi:hypothetical protein
MWFSLRVAGAVHRRHGTRERAVKLAAWARPQTPERNGRGNAPL